MPAGETKKPRLTEVIRKKSKALRVSFSTIAREVGMHESTFRNHLFSNHFDPTIWPAIARKIDMPEDVKTIEEMYDVYWMKPRKTYTKVAKGVIKSVGSLKEIMEWDCTNIIKAVAGAEARVTMDDLLFLMNFQQQLSQPMSSALVAELIKNRREG